MRVILFLILLFTPVFTFAGDTFEQWYSGSIFLFNPTTVAGFSITSGLTNDDNISVSALAYTPSIVTSVLTNNIPFPNKTPTTIYVDYTLIPSSPPCSFSFSVNNAGNPFVASTTSATPLVNQTLSGSYSGSPVTSIWLAIKHYSSFCNLSVTRVYDNNGFDYLNFKPTSIIINSDGILSDMLLNTTCVSDSATTSCAYEYSDVTTVDHLDSYFYFIMFFIVFWSFVFLATLFKKYKYGNY